MCRDAHFLGIGGAQAVGGASSNDPARALVLAISPVVSPKTSAEIKRFLANLDEFRRAVTDTASEWREFVTAWWARFQGRRVRVAGLFPLAGGLQLLQHRPRRLVGVE